jgi:UDP-N-acetylmuramate dehydrogenase
MSGIPGCVGATPIQNVGAYGQEVSATATRVRVYDRHTGATRELLPEECGFGYRTSVFKKSDRFVVTRVRFSLRAGDDGGVVRYPELARALGVPEGARAPLARIRDTVLALRRGKGMVVDASDPESVSAGSFFVNPVVDMGTAARVEEAAGATTPRFPAAEGKVKLSAGWLVERAGFARGFGDGRVGVSRKHALALVHRGGGTTRELLALARTIQRGVCERFGVTLEPEPVLVGCAW